LVKFNLLGIPDFRAQLCPNFRTGGNLDKSPYCANFSSAKFGAIRGDSSFVKFIQG
jgi:hypothetical protein